MKRVGFLSVASAAAAPQIVCAQPLTKMRIGTFPAESYGLAIYAKDQGFFARNGIDADVQYIATASGGITAALVGGALEAGCISMGPTSNAHLRGIPIRVVCPGAIITSESPTTALVVTRASGITSARGLNGKTIGVSVLKDVIHVAAVKWIDANGGDSKTVKVVEMTVPNGPPALESGRVDGYVLTEPLLTGTKDKFRALGYVYDVISRRTMISMHIAMQEWLDKNTEAGRRFVLAMRQAAQWANTNRDAAGAIISRETKIPMDVVARMNHVIYGETLDVTTIQPQIDALAEYKFIDRRFNVADVLWPGGR